MRYLRLFWALIVISVQRELAHRANLIFQALLTATGFAAGLATLGIVYSQTDTLAGWRFEETLVLLGVFYLMSGVLEAFISPNLAWFGGKLRQGELDDLLLQPVSSVFLASLGTCQPWALAQVALGAMVTAVGVAGAGGVPSAVQLAMFLLLLAAGVILTWASRVLLASLAFWAPHAELDVLYSALWQFGRYPLDVYHPAIRALLTYLLPVAFITIMPARALTRGVPLWLAGAGLAAGLGGVVLVLAVWRAGLRRYTSATS